MRVASVLVAMLVLTGCGVELLTTTAITGELQAQQLQAMKGQLGKASDQAARTNLQQAINTYYGEKGRYPGSLAELAPEFIPSVPNRANGTPFGYNSANGQLLDGPAPPVAQGPPPGDAQKMNQIRAAIDQYGRAVGFYPPSLAALVPTYLPAVPKTDSGRDFIFYCENGTLLHPDQAAQMQQAQAAPPSPQPQQPTQQAIRPQGAGMGAGPMGEVMTGIGVQNQLNSMGNSGVNSAGTYMRGKLGNATGQHNQDQEKAMDRLGL